MTASQLIEKLEKCYQGTFPRLPEDVQKVLETYWQGLGCRTEDGHYRPNLLIRPKLYKNSLEPPIRSPQRPWESPVTYWIREAQKFALFGPDLSVVNAQCLGDDLLFYERFVEESAPLFLEWAVAEELAHCYQAAPTKLRFPKAAIAIGLDSETLEREAKALVKQWGFKSISAASDN
jgi:hypothetical protein